MNRHLHKLIFGLALVLRAFGQDRRPVPIVMPNPAYPYEMARAGIGGAVVVEFIIGAQGTVLQSQVLQATRREFEAPALQAVAKWRFRPGEKAGRKVNVRATQLIEFNIDIPAVYPFELLQRGESGSATVEFAVNERGRASWILEIESTRPEFGRAVQAQVAATIYAPTLKGHSPYKELRRTTQKFEATGKGDVRVGEAARKILGLLQKKQAIPTAAELDTPLVPKAQPKPIFPPMAKVATGSAVVEIFIDEKGEVWLPRIITATQEEFGYAAMQAIVDWRYEPPRKNRKKTTVRAEILVEFVRPVDN